MAGRAKRADKQQAASDPRIAALMDRRPPAPHVPRTADEGETPPGETFVARIREWSRANVLRNKAAMDLALRDPVTPGDEAMMTLGVINQAMKMGGTTEAVRVLAPLAAALVREVRRLLRAQKSLEVEAAERIESLEKQVEALTELVTADKGSGSEGGTAE